MSAQTEIALTINGAERALNVAPWTTLLDALRDQLGLTGAKLGCNQGVCGACTVLRDGRPVRGCLSLAVNCAGSEITTVEGLADGGTLAAVQQAFLDAGAVQCGFCTPGVLLVVQALLRENPHPSIDEIRHGLSGNLCRCSGYRTIVDAVALCVGSAP